MPTYQKEVYIEREDGTIYTKTIVRLHSDDKYERDRNRLIRTAEAFADSKHGKVYLPAEDDPDYCDAWSKSFHEKMNELARGID